MLDGWARKVGVACTGALLGIMIGLYGCAPVAGRCNRRGTIFTSLGVSTLLIFGAVVVGMKGAASALSFDFASTLGEAGAGSATASTGVGSTGFEFTSALAAA